MWAGRTVFLLGGGPSLRGFDFDRLKGRGVVVAINDAVLHAPWADAVFTIDTVWLQRRRGSLTEFEGERIAAVPPDWDRSAWTGFTLLRRVQRPGLSRGMDAIYTGDNSGFAALGLAIMRDAARIALLGYDLTGPGHWHEGYEWRSRYGHADYQRWASYFPVLAEAARQRGVRVINCNPASGVRCFEFGYFEDIAE